MLAHRAARPPRAGDALDDDLHSRVPRIVQRWSPVAPSHHLAARRRPGHAPVGPEAQGAGPVRAVVDGEAPDGLLVQRLLQPLRRGVRRDERRRWQGGERVWGRELGRRAVGLAALERQRVRFSHRPRERVGGGVQPRHLAAHGGQQLRIVGAEARGAALVVDREPGVAAERVNGPGPPGRRCGDRFDVALARGEHVEEPGPGDATPLAAPGREHLTRAEAVLRGRDVEAGRGRRGPRRRGRGFLRAPQASERQQTDDRGARLDARHEERLRGRSRRAEPDQLVERAGGEAGRGRARRR